MKKLLWSLAIILPASVLAAENSVYAWGPWSEGVKPAAGPMYVAPTPVTEPQVDTRESLALLREYNSIQPPPPISIDTGVSVVNTSVPIVTTFAPVFTTPPPPPPGF